MKIESEHPFNDYDCYKNLHRAMNRMQVCLKHKHTKERRTILFSKYLMSIEIGRILGPHEEVDHIDGDKTNDHIENLQILTPTENRKKWIR